MTDLPSAVTDGLNPARLRQAVDASGEVIFMTDREGVFTFVNPEFERVYGYSSADVVGKVTPRVVKGGANTQKRYEEFWSEILDGQVARGLFVNRTKTGTLVDIEATINPIRNDAGEVVGFIAVQRDVTERRRTEEETRQGQKMEAIGLLAGGIAHDFNNVLTAILGYSELMLDRVAGDAGLVADLEEIRAAGERARRLTRQLLTFSRKQMLVPQVLELNRIVADVEKMLRRVIRENIALQLHLDPSLAPTKVDAGQIEQIVMNLAVNASDAMPKGGTLIIRTTNVTLGSAFVAQHSGLDAGDYVSLAVEDTGCGIPPEILDRVFEPFFTTKPEGRGTGLGLSTVYGIVKQSGGCVVVNSQVGVGTIVTSYFPKAKEPPSRAAAGSETSDLRGNETVLIAEDQGAVRGLMERILSDLGYRVLKADDGLDALAVEAAHPGGIDLLLSDVIMPRMSGPDLAQRVVGRHPNVRVLYVSGFPSHLATQLGTLGRRAAFLPKPFTPQQLARQVRELLDRGSAAPA